MSEPTVGDMFDGGDRTDEQKAEINVLGQSVVNLLSTASSYEVLIDVVTSMVLSAALNSGADEAFIGQLVANAMVVFPQFKAGRVARGSGVRQ